MSSVTTGEKMKTKAAMGPEPPRPPPAASHKKHRSHNWTSKQISSLRKENNATRAALKLVLTKSTKIFRALLEAQKITTKAGSTVWVDVTHLYSQNYGLNQNGYNGCASQASHQSQPRYYQPSAPAATLNTVEVENVIKELEAIGRVLEGTDLEAEAAGRRQVDSSSSQTSLESEPIVRQRFWKPKIVQEILIVSSDDDDAGNAKPSETRKKATTGKKSGPKPRKSEASQVMGKVKKPYAQSSQVQVKAKLPESFEPLHEKPSVTSKKATTGKKSGLKPNYSQASQVMEGKVKKPCTLQPSQVEDEPDLPGSLEPLDLSECQTQNCSQLAAANVASNIPASSQAGNSRNVGRQLCRKPCGKCGKLLNVGSLAKHSASKHGFVCKKAGCAKSFTSAKGLWDHQFTHETSSIEEYFPKI